MPIGVYDHTNNKGTTGLRWIVKDTSNMKGAHPKTEFKKGMIPWNKGLKGWMSDEQKKRFKNMAVRQTPWNKGKYGMWSGEENPNWKGGLHKKTYRLRRTQQWKAWRKQVFERDNYTCQRCVDMSEKGNPVILEPHHLFGVTDLVRNNLSKHIFNIDNGVTLCYPCHKYITAKQRGGGSN